MQQLLFSVPVLNCLITTGQDGKCVAVIRDIVFLLYIYIYILNYFLGGYIQLEF